MREILFRGKRVDNGEWIYGSLICRDSRCYIVDESDRIALRKLVTHYEDKYEYRCVRVVPESVGQFTGLYDSTKWEELTADEQALFLYPILGGKRSKEDWKGRRIFKGSIVVVTDDNGDVDFSDGGIGKVIELSGMWYVAGSPNNSLYDLANCYYLKVIGNVYDNPELLKGV